MENKFKNEKVKEYVYKMMENLNSIYKNIMSEKDAEKIINKYKDCDYSYEEIIKNINKIKQILIKEFLNSQNKTKTFIEQILNKCNISNTKEFFGMSLNYQLVYLLESYEKIEENIFSNREEKEEEFNKIKIKYVEELKKDNIEIFPEINQINYQIISNIYNNFIEDIDVVSCEYETSMQYTIKKDSSLYNSIGNINRDIFDFSKAEKIYDFATKHGKKINFTSLLDYFPNILEKELKNKSKERRQNKTLVFLEEYIKQIQLWTKSKRYQIQQIETIDRVSDENNAVNKAWENALNNTYYVDVLKLVRAYFLDSQLIYTESDEYIEEKTKKIIELINSIQNIEFLNDIKLLDGINLELHYKKFDNTLKRTINQEDIFKTMVMLSNINIPIYKSEKHNRGKKICIEQEKFINAMIVADRICDVRGITICNNIESKTKPIFLLDKDANKNNQYEKYASIYSKKRKETLFDEIKKEEVKKLTKIINN